MTTDTEQKDLVAIPEAPPMAPTYDAGKIQKSLSESLVALAQAKDLQINSNDDYEASGSLMTIIATRKNEVKRGIDEPIEAANKVHKFLTGIRSILLRPYEQADLLLQERREAWRQKCEKEDQERRDEEQRLAKEAQEAQAMTEAAELAAAGEHEAADIVLEQAASAPPPPIMVQSSVPKQAGISLRRSWIFVITNPKLVKKEFLSPDEKKIKPIVDRLGKDAVSIVGGIEVHPKSKESVRTKRK